MPASPVDADQQSPARCRVKAADMCGAAQTCVAISLVCFSLTPDHDGTGAVVAANVILLRVAISCVLVCLTVLPWRASQCICGGPGGICGMGWTQSSRLRVQLNSLSP